MLYDAEKLARKSAKKKLTKEYMDLVYDIESYVIDMSQGEEVPSPSKQARMGAEKIAADVFDEYERKNVYAVVRKILIELGIPESIKGFRILEECVLCAARLVKQGEGYCMSNIYRIVCERFCITSHNAERLCRYACDYIVPSRKVIAVYPFLSDLAHRTVEKVTVKEVVDVIVHHVVTRCRFVTLENKR